MKPTNIKMLALALTLAFGGNIIAIQGQDEIPYTDKFFLDECRLGPRGANKYFIPFKAGAYRLYKGEDEGEEVTLLITVLQRTRVVAGVRCAIMREVEWVGDELVEISWNYFAICPKCHDVFYYGEDVDIYEDGEVANHDGAWLAGKDGARAGLMMPGRPLIGSRYYQEIAPDVALDRAEHINDAVTVETPAGTFENCLFVAETTPLEPGSVSEKFYARGIGLVQDGVLKLVKYGYSRSKDDAVPEADELDD